MQRWMGFEAAAMEAVHGDVHPDRDGNVWTMSIHVADDLAGLRPRNSSANYWVGWLTEHRKRIATRHHAKVTVKREEDVLRLKFTAIT